MEESEKGKLAMEYRKPDKVFGVRHLQALLLFLLLAIGFGMRVILSVAINAMTDRNATKNPDVPVYDWDDKSIVLSSFFWGYITLQLFAGQLGKTYGPKWFLVVAITINAIACGLTPLVADKFGSKGVMVCRFMQGVFQGFLHPSLHNLLGRWAPTPERSTLSNIAFAGCGFGIVVGMPLTGFISASWYGWPWAFYLYAILGLIWVALWIAFGSNSPAQCRNMSQEERNYIVYSINSSGSREEVPTPWKEILKSLPFWAIIASNMGTNWGYNILLTEISSYLNGVMNYDIQANGLLSAAPYLAFFILGFVFGPIADSLINRKILSRGAVRKLFNTLGMGIPAFALLALGFVPSDLPVVSVILLIISIGMNAAVFCGFFVNHIDLAPNHAGPLMGLSSGATNVFSILGPLFVHAIVGNDMGNKYKWRIVFITSSVAFMVTNLFYVLFASGEVQPWNDALPKDEKLANERLYTNHPDIITEKEKEAKETC